MKKTKEQEAYLLKVQTAAEFYRTKQRVIQAEYAEKMRQELDRWRMDRDVAVANAIESGCLKAWVTKALGSSPNAIYEILERMEGSPLVEKVDSSFRVEAHSVGDGLRVDLSWPAYPFEDGTVSLIGSLDWVAQAWVVDRSVENWGIMQSEANTMGSLLQVQIAAAGKRLREAESAGD